MSKKTEQAVVRAAMRRYREWLREYPLMHSYVIAKDRDRYDMTDAAADCIRACHAHAKAAKAAKARKK